MAVCEAHAIEPRRRVTDANTMPKSDEIIQLVVPDKMGAMSAGHTVAMRSNMAAATR